MLIWIILFSILGSLGAITAAGGFLLLSEKAQNLLTGILISYATGTLLAAALLGQLNLQVMILIASCYLY